MGRFIADTFSKVLPFGIVYVKASKRGLHVPGLYVPESEADENEKAVMRHRYMKGSESQIDHLLSSALFRDLEVLISSKELQSLIIM